MHVELGQKVLHLLLPPDSGQNPPPNPPPPPKVPVISSCGVRCCFTDSFLTRYRVLTCSFFWSLATGVIQLQSEQPCTVPHQKQDEPPRLHWTIANIQRQTSTVEKTLFQGHVKNSPGSWTAQLCNLTKKVYFFDPWWWFVVFTSSIVGFSNFRYFLLTLSDFYWVQLNFDNCLFTNI